MKRFTLKGNVQRSTILKKVAFLTIKVEDDKYTSYFDVKTFDTDLFKTIEKIDVFETVKIDGYLSNEKTGKKDDKGYDIYELKLIADKIL